MASRRAFLKSSATLSALASVPLSVRWSVARAIGLVPGLSDPAFQMQWAGFANAVPDALQPAFKYDLAGGPVKKAKVGVYGPFLQQTGLVAGDGATRLNTAVFGYGDGKTGQGKIPWSWPGKTFEVAKDVPLEVTWDNNLAGPHPIVSNAQGGFADGPVDTSLHWAFSLHGYENYTIAANGVPIITHLHGGHTAFQFDGNPEQFYTPGNGVEGPRYPGTNAFEYLNDQVAAGNLWYHDHALGITRLNVYAGMAGFYFVRDALDTGTSDNPLGLPAWPYEKAYAIQDRMFTDAGSLFYPSFPGDPFYADFIYGEGAVLPPEVFGIDGGATALAEFFGDHMVVNGVIWPKEDVEPRNYRLHLLNGTDSRFMGIRFRAVPAAAKDLANASEPIPFHVIGSDQGLGAAATQIDTLLMGPGERYDIVFDFKGLQGKRIIMENIGGDAPFGGDLVGPGFPSGDLFPDRQTDRIMAFDVMELANRADAFDPAAMNVYQPNGDSPDRVRRLALFEGNDEFGRLQPLLGTAEPTVDASGTTVNGALTWAASTTENPNLNDTEVWEIYNATGDAHPIHLHLVHFDILDRQSFKAKVVQQPIVQHNGSVGVGFRLESIKMVGKPEAATGVELAPKDMVTALPGEVTRIKTKFDKPGRYVWHCHILSHEDHEMMRVLHVGPGA
jgi:spore coat protein A